MGPRRGRARADRPAGGRLAARDLDLSTEEARHRALLCLRAHCKRLPADGLEPFVEDLHRRLGGPAVDSGVPRLGRAAAPGGRGRRSRLAHAHAPDARPLRAGARPRELLRSIEDLERELGTVSPLFAYPAGQLNDPRRPTGPRGRLPRGLHDRAGHEPGRPDGSAPPPPHQRQRDVVRGPAGPGDAVQPAPRRAGAHPSAPRRDVSAQPPVLQGLDAVLTAPLAGAGGGTPRPPATRRSAGRPRR